MKKIKGFLVISGTIVLLSIPFFLYAKLSNERDAFLENYNLIEIGMSIQEVEEILGTGKSVGKGTTLDQKIETHKYTPRALEVPNIVIDYADEKVSEFYLNMD